MVAELVEEALVSDDEVEDDPRVHADPAHRQEELGRGWDVGSSPAEGAPREHHLVHARLVSHRREEPEQGAADDVSDHDDQNGLDETETEDRAERSEHPVDRREIGAHPDPELLKRRRVPVCNRYRLDAVRVETNRLAQLTLFLLDGRHMPSCCGGVPGNPVAGLCSRNRTGDNPKKVATSALLLAARPLRRAPGPPRARRPRRRR